MLSVRVDVVEYLGADAYLYVSLVGSDTAHDVSEVLTVRCSGEVDVHAGDTIGLSFSAQNCHLFDSSEQALGAPAAPH